MSTLVCVNLADCVCVCVVFATLIRLSGWSVILPYACWILVSVFVWVFRFLLPCDLVRRVISWHVSVCADIVQPPLTVSCLFFSVSLSGLFWCQCKLTPVMDYSRKDANRSWQSQNSIPLYWDQLHRMLSPIVPYSEYFAPFFLSSLLHVRPNRLTWL